MSARLAALRLAGRLGPSRRSFPVPLWAQGLGLGLSVLAAILPVELALALPVALATLVLGFLQPFVALLLLALSIPFSSLVALDLNPLKVSIAEPLVAVLALGWLGGSLLRREVRLHGGFLLVGLLAFLVAMLVSTIVAWEFALAAGEVVKWAELLMVYLYCTDRLRQRWQAMALLATLFLAGLVEAAIGLFQFATGSGPEFFAIGDFLRAYGTFGQPNPFAGYLATIVPLAAGVVLVGPELVPRWLRLLALGTGLVLCLAILTSLSRGTWLSLGLALAAMVLVWERRTRRYLLPAGLAAALLGALAALGALPGVVVERLATLFESFGVFDVRGVDVTPENFAVVERMAHWQAGWYMFLDYPWLGVGPGNYAAAYSEYFLPGWVEPLGHAHNYYLNTAAEMGVLGVAALGVLGVAAYRLVLTGLRHAPGRLERALLASVLGSIVVLTAYNGFDNLLVHGMTMQFGMLFGLAFAATRGLDGRGG